MQDALVSDDVWGAGAAANNPDGPCWPLLVLAFSSSPTILTTFSRPFPTLTTYHYPR